MDHLPRNAPIRRTLYTTREKYIRELYNIGEELNKLDELHEKEKQEDYNPSVWQQIADFTTPGWHARSFGPSGGSPTTSPPPKAACADTEEDMSCTPMATKNKKPTPKKAATQKAVLKLPRIM
eukprot:TRINITY_DN67475_c6_g6_i1.p1 TRINITY_DN67475_c6_g6~~TRINITY_DN67475_c6_g6_i1.p1  ORF type:complete len:123 (-),score=24.09 TRINITY_DN67475_c6_g6_i1:83-451(-)